MLSPGEMSLEQLDFYHTPTPFTVIKLLSRQKHGYLSECTVNTLIEHRHSKMRATGKKNQIQIDRLTEKETQKESV